MGGGLAVGAQYRGVEAGCALELALRAAAGVLVGEVRVCADGTGRSLLTPEVVVSIAEAFGTLGASIKAEVLGDLQALPKEEEAFQGSGGVGASYDGQDHRGGLFPCSLLRFSEPAGCSVEDNAWIE